MPSLLREYHVRRLAFTLTALLVSVSAAEARADDSAQAAKPAAAAPSAKPADATPSAKTADATASAKAADAKDAKAADTADGKDTPSVLLHVTSPTPVRIENSDTGEVVCTSPCDKNVPAALRYRVGAGGFGRASSEFVLTGQDGKADLKVKPARRSQFWTGVTALGVGGALIAGGVTVLAIGVGNRAHIDGADGETTDNSFTDMMAIGTGLTILGTSPAFGAGHRSSRTRARASTATWPSRARIAPAPTLPAARARLPSVDFEWAPRPTFVPILRGTF